MPGGVGVGSGRAPRLAHHIGLVGRDLEVVAEWISEVHRPGARMINDPSGPTILLKTELHQAGDERQPLHTAEAECHPVKPRRGTVPLGLAGEESELGATAVGGKHEGASGLAGPLLRAGHRAAAEDPGVPLRRFGPIRDEELDVIKGETERGEETHAMPTVLDVGMTTLRFRCGTRRPQRINTTTRRRRPGGHPLQARLRRAIPDTGPAVFAAGIYEELDRAAPGGGAGRSTASPPGRGTVPAPVLLGRVPPGRLAINQEGGLRSIGL